LSVKKVMTKIEKKEYSFDLFERIFFLYCKNKPSLVVKTEYKKATFYFLPRDIKVFSDINKNIFLICYKTDCTKCTFFISTFEKYLDFKVKIGNLYLKGLGFKINVLKESNVLQLKLGFSHLIYLKIPEEITKIVLLKKGLRLESYNVEILGNFIFKIRSYKIPDSYKGKGLYYKYEKEKLKVIKKK